MVKHSPALPIFACCCRRAIRASPRHVPYASVSGMSQSVTLLAEEILTAVKNYFGLLFERRLKTCLRLRIRCGAGLAAGLCCSLRSSKCTSRGCLCRAIVGGDSKATSVAFYAALKAIKRCRAVPAAALSRLWPRERKRIRELVKDTTQRHGDVLPFTDKLTANSWWRYVRWTWQMLDYVQAFLRTPNRRVGSTPVPCSSALQQLCSPRSCFCTCCFCTCCRPGADDRL